MYIPNSRQSQCQKNSQQQVLKHAIASGRDNKMCLQFTTQVLNSRNPQTRKKNKKIKKADKIVVRDSHTDTFLKDYRKCI